jgi:hypothetical protein
MTLKIIQIILEQQLLTHKSSQAYLPKIKTQAAIEKVLYRREL